VTNNILSPKIFFMGASILRDSRIKRKVSPLSPLEPFDDFLMLLFKSKLTTYAASLNPRKIEELNRALRYALQLS
jgi:hypothetical protein